MNKSVMASHKLFGLADNRTNVWATPKNLFNQLNDIFKFETDVCALPENAKCEKYFTPEQDGLSQEWTGVCWMNPPYGREINKWVEKASYSASQGHTVVALLPVRTDTTWWQKYCLNREIHYIAGRLRFNDSESNAPFGCAIVVFRPSLHNFIFKR